ncbi:MAG: signal peptidase [Deltaproteobacteria bacterium]|nr:signal peptidase [Deltaproteobacteria bacterium]
MRQDAMHPERSGGGAKKGRFREYVEAFGIALVIALVVRTLLLQAFKIPSSSMENTLLVGDHIFVNKFIYGYHIPFTKGRVLQFKTPQRGDIIVFVFPEDPSKDFIKRVIGVPGDVVEVRDKTVLLNGETLTEGYARYVEGDDASQVVHSRDDMLPVKVPAGKYFVMGDNRDRSYDSRFWGFVDEEAVIGKALFIYFSIDWNKGIGWMEVWRWPELIRWGRIGDVLK